MLTFPLVASKPLQHGKSIETHLLILVIEVDVDISSSTIVANFHSSGERNVCDENYGFKIAGPPDGVGAYLADDHTLRVVVQSESYGPLRGKESFHFKVNDGAEITGSHIQYVDYDRTMFSTFMDHDTPASEMVTGMGEMIETMINLKGEPVGRRAKHGSDPVTSFGAHYGNTGKFKYIRITSICRHR